MTYHSEAWWRGYHDYIDGIKENPYSSVEESDDWEDGWHEAAWDD